MPIQSHLSATVVATAFHAEHHIITFKYSLWTHACVIVTCLESLSVSMDVFEDLWMAPGVWCILIIQYSDAWACIPYYGAFLCFLVTLWKLRNCNITLHCKQTSLIMLLCVAFYKKVPQQKNRFIQFHWLNEWRSCIDFLVWLCDFSFLCVSIFAGRYPSALITSAQTQIFCSRELKSGDLKSHLSLLLNACGCVCLNACVRVTGVSTWSGSQFEEKVNEGGI